MSTIKTAEIGSLLRNAAGQIRKLQEKVAGYERREKVDKVMDKMASKEIETDLSVDELRADLMKKAEEGKLEMIEEAVNYSTNLSTMKLASHDGENATPSSVSGAELDAFILGGGN